MAYWSFLNDLLRMEMPAIADPDGHGEASTGVGSVDPPMPREFESNRRIGAAGLVTGHWAKRLASTSGSGLNSGIAGRSEEHTSELQSLMRISYAVFCLKKKITETDSTHKNNDMLLTY